MIQTTLQELSLPDAVRERITCALHYLRDTDFSVMEDGTYPVRGEDIFAVVQSFTVTDPIDTEFETHRKYLDIQYVVKGRLDLMIARREYLRNPTPYDVQADILFYDRTERFSELKMHEGEMAILFPDDGHRMVCFPEAGRTPFIRKVIVKVLYDETI